MIVQVVETYSDDCDCNDYEEGEIIRIGRDSASYTILDDSDQDPEDSERCGKLTSGGEYVFRNGRSMGLVNGRWIDWKVEEF